MTMAATDVAVERRKSETITEPTVIWRAGFHPPKGISAEVVKSELDKLPEPSPENLLEASKKKRHPLHKDLWSETDAEWAYRGRLERCRHIIGSVVELVPVGGRKIENRVYEFVKPNGQGRWFSVEEIVRDPDLRDAHLAEISRLQDQAAARLAKFRELMREV